MEESRSRGEVSREVGSDSTWSAVREWLIRIRVNLYYYFICKAYFDSRNLTRDECTLSCRLPGHLSKPKGTNDSKVVTMLLYVREFGEVESEVLCNFLYSRAKTCFSFHPERQCCWCRAAHLTTKVVTAGGQLTSPHVIGMWRLEDNMGEPRLLPTGCCSSLGVEQGGHRESCETSQREVTSHVT